MLCAKVHIVANETLQPLIMDQGFQSRAPTYWCRQAGDTKVALDMPISVISRWDVGEISRLVEIEEGP